MRRPIVSVFGLDAAASFVRLRAASFEAVTTLGHSARPKRPTMQTIVSAELRKACPYAFRYAARGMFAMASTFNTTTAATHG